MSTASEDVKPYSASRETLLEDLCRVAEETAPDIPRTADYEELGAYCYRTIWRRFGSWEAALLAAGVIDERPQPVYRDPEWLESKYWGDGMTLEELAEEAGAGVHTIYKWMRRHGIETRSISEAMGGRFSDIPMDPGVLSEMYWDRGMTQEEIGREFGVSQPVVSAAMRELGVPTRGAGLTDEQVLDAIRDLADDLGHPPTAREWKEHGRHGYNTVRSRFGTFGRGRRLALEGD